jgi:beta-galactosidase
MPYNAAGQVHSAPTPSQRRIRRDGVTAREGDAVLPPVAPGTSAEVRLQLPDIDWVAGSEYHLDVRYIRKADDGLLGAGHEEAAQQFDLGMPGGPAPASRPGTSRSSVAQSGNAFVLSAGDVRAEIDRSTGLLRSFRKDERELLAAPLVPDFWRAPTDNDFGGNWQDRLGVWKDAGPGFRPTSVTTSSVNGVTTVTATGTIPAGSTPLVLTYTLAPDGTLEVGERMEPVAGADLPRMPRFGMRTQLPARYHRTEWFGRSPIGIVSRPQGRRRRRPLVARRVAVGAPLRPAAGDRQPDRRALARAAR